MWGIVELLLRMIAIVLDTRPSSTILYLTDKYEFINLIYIKINDSKINVIYLIASSS